MPVSPTSRSLQYLKSKLGVKHVGVVERWIPGANIRQDLFGFVDIVAIMPDSPFPRLLFIQCTSQTNVGARVKKIQESLALRDLVQTGQFVEVWGWAKRGPRGKRKTWTLSRKRFWLERLGGDIVAKELNDRLATPVLR